VALFDEGVVRNPLSTGAHRRDRDQSTPTTGIDVVRSGKVTVALPKGELNASSVAELQRRLATTITPRRNRMVLDLEDVPSIDSSGLRVIVDAMKQARRCGGDLRVCGLQPAVRSVFDMTRLGTIIDIHPSRADAVAAWD
jgi:anti-anti-sigma factor